MLKSTGFFRGIDCPFYSEGNGGRNGCNRPFCHFRHCRQRGVSYGADVKKAYSAQKEGYDPFNPEVVRPQEKQNGRLEASDDISGALEQVNKAIEEVQNQVERDKRKLSYVGNEPYDPSEKPSSSFGFAKAQTVAGATTHSEYDPGSYQITSEIFSPIPGWSKYTLYSDNQDSGSDSMEYIPTSLKKPSSRTPYTSPPVNPKYSSNCKYTLDISKPSTDMEYDPLSNFSAGIKSKDVEKECAVGRDRTQRAPRISDDEYVPAVKKLRQGSIDTSNTYTISDSDDENSGSEYRPTSLSSLKQRKSKNGSPVDMARRETNERTKETLKASSLNNVVDLTLDSESVEDSKARKKVEKKKLDRESSPLKIGAPEKVKRLEKKSEKKTFPVKLSSNKKASKGSLKVLSPDVKKKDRIIIQKDERKVIKLTDKDPSERKRSHAEVKSNDLSKTCSKKRDRGVENDTKERKKLMTSGMEKMIRNKDKHKRNGIHDMNRKDKGAGKSNSEVCSSNINKRSSKDINHAPSHVDLFGDDSADEAEPIEVDDESEEELVRKSADALKRKRWLMKKVLQRSTSEDERATASSDNVNSDKIDCSIFKDDLDFESESLEECLRIFNESTEVKTEDKGRQAKQPLKDSEEVRGADHTLNTSSQKKRVSHFAAKGSVENESEEELVRKSADALKRKRWLMKKVLQRSTSEDERATASSDNVNSDEIDCSIFKDDFDFESDPLEECLRIFNESKEVKTEDKGRQAKQPLKDSEEVRGADHTLNTSSQKKRVSHFAAKGSTEATSKAVMRPHRTPTAQEVCYQRMQMAQEQAAQLSAAVKSSSLSSSSFGSFGERKRIAHLPSPLLASSKTRPVDGKQAGDRVLSPCQKQPTVRTQTTAGILSKTVSTTPQKRVAHTPTLKSASMKRPIIPVEFGAKVSTIIRQRYLNTFIDECVKFCTSEHEAFQMGLDEEKMVYDRSSSKNIYLNLAVNTLKKLRSKSSSSSSLGNRESGAVKRVQSHEGVLGGRLAATTSFTVNRMGKKQEEKLTGTSLYYKMKTYLMTEEQLQEHGYPRVNPAAAGKAIIFSQSEKKISSDPLTKICCRCGTEYKINHKGNCVRIEECSFHWGRLRRHRVPGGWETSYSCCSGAVGSPGCQVSKQHVQDGREESLDGYVTTFSKPVSPDGNGGVFALDCEMCYTKQGLELTRVTVIDSNLKVIYDTFVKPQSPVVDYNTRFSGVTEEDLESVTITLRDVQAVLLSMFSAESILLGHSLESDFLALKLIHSSVVDTSIVFPHRLGLPYKRALRNLMAEHLKRIIQDSVDGHDSSEDACACMELMIWKIKEDAKLKR
ncbi:RNA exonuclease 1 homolog isoform X1 [Synchiropus splendidus]|uniref:RNA exonuclease 1 homolog isoform X1 n=1 Tax=Synchiropus splendidus TaxID=270530 RepID=UPI00237ED34E|nr:RNA exonuclease 1 homolog isoform X1 [Synchiropus splendidus]